MYLQQIALQRGTWHAPQQQSRRCPKQGCRAGRRQPGPACSAACTIRPSSRHISRRSCSLLSRWLPSCGQAEWQRALRKGVEPVCFEGEATPLPAGPAEVPARGAGGGRAESSGHSSRVQPRPVAAGWPGGPPAAPPRLDRKHAAAGDALVQLGGNKRAGSPAAAQGGRIGCSAPAHPPAAAPAAAARRRPARCATGSRGREPEGGRGCLWARHAVFACGWMRRQSGSTWHVGGTGRQQSACMCGVDDVCVFFGKGEPQTRRPHTRRCSSGAQLAQHLCMMVAGQVRASSCPVCSSRKFWFASSMQERRSRMPPPCKAARDAPTVTNQRAGCTVPRTRLRGPLCVQGRSQHPTVALRWTGRGGRTRGQARRAAAQAAMRPTRPPTLAPTPPLHMRRAAPPSHIPTRPPPLAGPPAASAGSHPPREPAAAVPAAGCDSRSMQGGPGLGRPADGRLRLAGTAKCCLLVCGRRGNALFLAAHEAVPTTCPGPLAVHHSCPLGAPALGEGGAARRAAPATRRWRSRLEAAAASPQSPAAAAHPQACESRSSRRGRRLVPLVSSGVAGTRWCPGAARRRGLGAPSSSCMQRFLQPARKLMQPLKALGPMLG